MQKVKSLEQENEKLKEKVSYLEDWERTLMEKVKKTKNMLIEEEKKNKSN